MLGYNLTLAKDYHNNFFSTPILDYFLQRNLYIPILIRFFNRVFWIIFNMNLKLRLITIISLFSLIPAFADSGLYAGIGAGYGTINTNTTNGFSFPSNSSSSGGGNIAGSVFVGYDFSHYVGVQFDYDYIGNVQYSSGSTIPGITGSFNANQQLLALGIIGHLPFGLFANNLSGLSIFGKLSAGYTFTSFSGGSVIAPQASNYQVNLPASSSSLVPVVGAGVEYGINSVGVRLEYDYVGNTPVTNNNQTLLNVNDSLVLLSVLYHF